MKITFALVRQLATMFDSFEEIYSKCHGRDDAGNLDPDIEPDYSGADIVQEISVIGAEAFRDVRAALDTAMATEHDTVEFTLPLYDDLGDQVARSVKYEVVADTYGLWLGLEGHGKMECESGDTRVIYVSPRLRELYDPGSEITAEIALWGDIRSPEPTMLILNNALESAREQG